MNKSTQAAMDFIDACNRYGWLASVRGSIVEIAKQITPESNEEFCQADSEYYDILSHIPRTRAGSIWGTDGGGIGALTALRTGVFRMKMSGGSKRVLKEIQKELAYGDPESYGV